MIFNKVKKVAVLCLVGALMIDASSTHAASEIARLTSGSKSASSAILPNAKGWYTWSGAVGTLSAYQVQYKMYGGVDSASCTTLLSTRNISIAGMADKKKVTVDKSRYLVGKVTLYGNTSGNPKTGCTAVCTFRNTDE